MAAVVRGGAVDPVDEAVVDGTTDADEGTGVDVGETAADGLTTEAAGVDEGASELGGVLVAAAVAVAPGVVVGVPVVTQPASASTPARTATVSLRRVPTSPR